VRFAKACSVARRRNHGPIKAWAGRETNILGAEALRASDEMLDYILAPADSEMAAEPARAALQG